MNTAIARTAPIAALLAVSLLCCAGCGNNQPAGSPDLAWKPETPALQADAGGDAASDATPELDGATIDALLDEVSSPAAGAVGNSQDAADLIAAHPNAHSELLAGGDATLRHLVRAFLGGGQAGARAEVMLALIEELLGEEAPLVEAEIAEPESLSGADAQARFDAWFAAAGILLDRHGLDFMRENMPHTYVLLTALQG